MTAPLAAPDFDVVIIGAGFSGLGMGRALLKAGRGNFLILERASEVGGTWRDNTYPGCACDVPSNLYSFSFAPNPDWSRAYSPQAEILDYLKRCAQAFGLLPKIRFNTAFRAARFDEAAALWRIDTDRGALTARVLVSATGPLNKPATPALPGLAGFEGRVFHSAAWDHGYDLQGKRVAVIGTGASAIQFVPAIAPKTAHLALFQRTPPWVLPRLDRAFQPWEKTLNRLVPLTQAARRRALYWSMEARAIGFTLAPKRLAVVERLARRFIARSIADPELRRAVTPDYRIGCKRVLISNDYYPSLNASNVELVTSPVGEVRSRSIVSADGREREIDAIIFGTGFHATDFLGATDFHGLGGRSLKAEWAKTAQAYLGTTVAGYPNLFLLVGPNTGLGHNSLIYMIEAQVHYVLEALNAIDREGATSIDVSAAAQGAFNAGLQRRMQRTVWASGCKSWYMTDDGRNPTLWPGFTFTFRRRTRRLLVRDYSFESAKVRSAP